MTRLEIALHLQAVYEELAAHLGITIESFNESFIAGGCIASLVLGDPVKDYDVWFKSEAARDRIIDGIIHKADKVTVFSVTIELPSGKLVQLVKTRIGEPATTVGSFDYRHTQSFYTPLGQLEYDEEFIKSRVLEYNKGNLCHPVNTVQRAMKFAKRGYKMPQEDIMDMMLDIRSAPVEKILSGGSGSGGSR